MKVLFLTQTGVEGASARYRVYQYLPYLRACGVATDVSPATAEWLLRWHERGGGVAKGAYYGSQLAKRLLGLFSARSYDVVFLQRDLIVHLAPVIERLYSRLNPRLVFDIDDAIDLVPPYHRPGALYRFFGHSEKISEIARLARHVIAANSVLLEIARREAPAVTLIPTSIDTDATPLVERTRPSAGRVAIGWIGSPDTAAYLEPIVPVIRNLARRYPLVLRVLGAQPFSVPGVYVETAPWRQEAELAWLASIDIGLMPLSDDRWSRAKSGTKLLQYMASGLPSVASPVGANCEIVRHGCTGFLAKDAGAWREALEALIRRPDLRREFGCAARKRVEEKYSLSASAPKLLRALRSAAGLEDEHP